MAVMPPIPENEEQRLEWLRQCEILDTLPEQAFDEVAAMAADFCRVPIAAINLVDRDRQWSKAAVGQDKAEDGRAVSFCAHAILGDDLMVVPDALKDPRFTDNPLVTGDPHIRFYASAPLITSEGLALGSLCVVDRVPRRLSGEQAALLRLLARQVVGRIELTRHIRLQDRLMEDRARLQREAEEQKAAFLREVLRSVTAGRLRLCRDRDELPAALAPEGDWVPLTVPSDLGELRRRAQGAAARGGFAESRWSDLVTAAGEAAMNALVHGGGGRGRVCGRGGGTVQVWVEDGGRGIAADRLPRAALERGYTTAGTLGQGMKTMLDTADRVYLLTGEGGTAVVVEQDREPPHPPGLPGGG